MIAVEKAISRMKKTPEGLAAVSGDQLFKLSNYILSISDLKVFSQQSERL